MESVSQFVKVALLAILSGLISEVRASSSATPIQTVAADLDYALEIFLEANDGAVPGSWDDVDRLLLSRETGGSAEGIRSRLFRNIEGILGGSLETQFPLFIQREINVEGSKDSQFRSSGKLIAVVADTVIEGRRGAPGRYAIILTEANEIKHGWIDESYLQDQFDKAGESLPTGPPRVQPETFDEELNRLGREFAEKNFVDPERPTEAELQEMEDHFRDLYRDEGSNRIVQGETVEEPQETRSSSRGKKSAGFPKWPLVVAAIAVLGILALLIRAFLRKRVP